MGGRATKELISPESATKETFSPILQTKESIHPVSATNKPVSPISATKVSTKEPISPIPHTDSNILTIAEGGDKDDGFVDQEKHWQNCWNAVRHAVSKGQMLALDCEGDSLSRKGKILPLSIATREKSYILDIQKLKALPFERGLREILEDKNVMKLMFDCREDADALFHQFHVKLDGVIDIQLLEIMKRREFERKNINGKRGDHTYGAIYLRSLLGCIRENIAFKEMVKQKEYGKELEMEWAKRPLTAEQIKYAETDVLSLFCLFDHFKPDDEEMTRLKVASQIYVDLKWSIPFRVYNDFENNKYLPVDIIPDKGTTSFPVGFFSCTTCHRLFPTDEFSKNQLKKHNQMCRTCKKVKNDKDEHKNRLANYERTKMEEESRLDQYEYELYDSEHERAERDEWEYEEDRYDQYCGSDDEWW